MNLINANLTRHRFGCRLTVAGQHDDFHASLVQGCNGIRRCRLDRVGNTDQPGRFAIQRDEHHRLAFAAIGFGAGFQRVVKCADPAHHLRIADRKQFAIDAPLRAFAGDGFEV